MRSFDFAASDFPFVTHSATESYARSAARTELDLLSTIIDGTKRTFEFAASHGTPAFLLTSSGAVYGRKPIQMTHVPETYLGGPDPLNLTSLYPEGKRLAEQLCAQYSRRFGIGTKIARCWAFCGHICRWTSTLRLTTSSETCAQSDRSRSKEMVRPGARTCMQRTWPRGCGPSCSARPNSCLSTWVRNGI